MRYFRIWGFPRVSRIVDGQQQNSLAGWFCWCTFPGWMDADRMREKRSVRKVINFQDEPLILSIYRTLLIHCRSKNKMMQRKGGYGRNEMEKEARELKKKSSRFSHLVSVS